MRFTRFACFDWSGANVAQPKGIALAIAEEDGPPRLIERRWSRADVLDWLREAGRGDEPILIGLDLSPGLPFADEQAFFPGEADTPADARTLWEHVDRLSAETPHLSAGGFLRHPSAREHFLHAHHRGARFTGNGRMRRCEARLRGLGLTPSSCLKLIGPGQVGKSSLTGMRVLHQLGGAPPVWPFDPIPARGPLIVEVYPGIAAVAAGRRPTRTKMRCYEELDAALTHPHIGSVPTGRTGPAADHATDALLTAAWLRRVAGCTELWFPCGLKEVRATEGWTFGVP